VFEGFKGVDSELMSENENLRMQNKELRLELKELQKKYDKLLDELQQGVNT
jgi:regulator of replication initiation timing